MKPGSARLPQRFACSCDRVQHRATSTSGLLSCLFSWSRRAESLLCKYYLFYYNSENATLDITCTIFSRKDFDMTPLPSPPPPCFTHSTRREKQKKVIKMGQARHCFFFNFYWLILERRTDRHWFVVLVIYAFIGWFLCVPWLGIEPATLVYRDDTTELLGQSKTLLFMSTSLSLSHHPHGLC